MKNVMMCLLSILLLAGCEYVPPPHTTQPQQVMDVFCPVTLYFQFLSNSNGGTWVVALRTEPDKFCPRDIINFTEYESETGCLIVKLKTVDDPAIKHYHSYRCRNPNCTFNMQNTGVER